MNALRLERGPFAAENQTRGKTDDKETEKEISREKVTHSHFQVQGKLDSGTFESRTLCRPAEVSVQVTGGEQSLNVMRKFINMFIHRSIIQFWTRHPSSRPLPLRVSLINGINSSGIIGINSLGSKQYYIQIRNKVLYRWSYA